VLTSVLSLLTRAGAPGRVLASRLDLARMLGLRGSLERLRDDRAFTAPARSLAYEQIWRDAADELAAELTPLGKGFLEFRRADRRARVWDHVTPLDDPVTLRLALDKALVHRLLTEASLPVPEHVVFDAAETKPALEFLQRADGPCVVKPVSGSFGTGVTANIVSNDQLQRAAWHAAKVERRLLIERQASGSLYRLLFLDGKLLDVIRRDPPHVRGDGRSTVLQLVRQENERRIAAGGARAPALLYIDLDSVFTLARVGLSPRTVAAQGLDIVVTSVVSRNRRGENHTVRADVSALAAEALRGVAATGLRLAGVDVVTPDPTRPLREAGGVLLEVNGTPGLHYHYEVAEPEQATRVAVPVLGAMLS